MKRLAIWVMQPPGNLGDAAPSNLGDAARSEDSIESGDSNSDAS